MKYRLEKTPMEGTLGDFPGPVDLIKVDETKWERLWDDLVRRYHYLGFDSVIGSRAKYLITLGPRVVGAISFCSAVYKLGPRDRFVGWDEAARLAMLPALVNNNRFLILPWIKVRNLASHVLSLSLKRLRGDWKRMYDVEPVMAETFVDRDRYPGTCYAAANWIRLGETKGFGRRGNTFEYHGNSKHIFVKIMSRRFISAFHPSLDRLEESGEELLNMIGAPPLRPGGLMGGIGLADLTPEDLAARLAEHLSPYLKYLHRTELPKHFVAMVKGLLSDLERKTIQNICSNYLDISELRNLQNFMRRSGWNHEGMLGEYQSEAGALLSHPQAMITGDGRDFPKKGDMSAGVARQRRGLDGRIVNCQASVMVGVAGPNGCGLLDCRLHVPEKWFDEAHAERREKCHFPEGLEFKTRSETLLEMINEAAASGRFKGKYVGVDSSFGGDPALLDSLPGNLIYFADVPASCQVFPTRTGMAVPGRSGGGRAPAKAAPDMGPRSVKELIEGDGAPWRYVGPGLGAEGPIVKVDKRLRVVEERSGKPGKDVWLHARRYDDGSIKYALCNESMDAAFRDLRAPAMMRWSMERCFNEREDHLGMGHYEVRTWHGWHRHMLLVLIAHLFIHKLRRGSGRDD